MINEISDMVDNIENAKDRFDRCITDRRRKCICSKIWCEYIKQKRDRI